MDRPSIQYHRSEIPSGSQRTVIPKLQVDGDIKKKTHPVDSRIVMKSSGVSSEVKRENDGEKQVPSPIRPPSSQAYEKYLTEMEFKIRYMKNDIEYKQEQIRKRAKVDTTLSINSQISHQPSEGLLKGSRNLVRSSVRGDSESVQNKTFSHSFQSTGYKKHSKSIPHKVLHQSGKIGPRPHFNSKKTEPIKITPTHLIVDSQSAHASSRVGSSSSSSAPVHPRVVSPSLPVSYKVSSSCVPAVSRHVVYPTLPQSRGDVSSSVRDHSRVVLSSAPHHSRVVLSSALSHSKIASSLVSSKIVSTSVPVNPSVVSSSVHVNSRIVSPSASAQNHSHVVSSSAPVSCTVDSSSTSVNSRETSTPTQFNSRQAPISAPVNSTQAPISVPVNSTQAPISVPVNSTQAPITAPVNSRKASTSAPINSRKLSTFSTVNLTAVSSVPTHSSVVSVAKPSHSKAISTQSSMQNLTSRSPAPNFTSPAHNSPGNKRQVVVLWKRGHQNEYGCESSSQKAKTFKNGITVDNPMPGSTTQTSGSELSSKLAFYPLPTSSAQNSPSKYRYVAPSSTAHTRKGLSSPSSQSQACPGLITPQKTPTFHTYHSQPVPVTVVTQVPNINRQTSCEAKSGKKITPLKVKTAAKLVSKYKWKRPSPTSVSKMAPSFNAPSRSLAGCRRKEKILIDHSSSKLRKVNLFKIDKRKFISNLARSKSCTFTVHSKKSLPLQTNVLTNISSFERKSKSRYSLKLTGQLSAKVCSKQKSTSGASIFPLEGNVRNKHHWTSVDRRTKDLKKSLDAKRHAALSRFRWKSSKAITAGQPVIAGTSRFKWSQDSQNKNKLSQIQLQRHFVSGPSKISTRMPFALHHLQKSTKLVMIGGVVYRSSPRSLKRAVQLKRKDGRLLHQNLIHGKRNSNLLGNMKSQNVKLIHVRGIPYHLDARGKKLCRALGSGAKKGIPTVSSIAGVSLKSTKLNFEKAKDIQKKTAASRALHRSLAYVAAKHKKDNRVKKGKQRYCMFFCRFGKCHRGDRCPYVHDPNKVVVCTRFLRGKCDVKNCLFSHDASVHKMPVCLYYLQGLCSREDCMYLHVNVSPSAPPCKDFLQGFCSLGKKCKKLHSFLCPSFAVFGKCSKGDKCTLLHRHSKKSPVAFPLKNSKPKSSNLIHGEKVEGQGTTELLPMSSSQNEVARDSSLLAEGESDSIPQTGKPSPLKSQPAFISLPSLKPSDVLKVKVVAPDVQSSRERKPKIKPEFSRLTMGEAMTNSRGNEAGPDAAEHSVPVSSQDVVSNKKDAIKFQTSGFINLSSSLDSDFIRVESLDPFTQDGFQDSSSTPQIGVEKNLGQNQENQSSPKTTASKAVLFKGIIPNFLPSSLPIRKAPGSQ